LIDGLFMGYVALSILVVLHSCRLSLRCCICLPCWHYYFIQNVHHKSILLPYYYLKHMAVVHLLVLQKLKEGDVCGTAKVGYGVTRHTAACWQLQICKLSCWWVSAADKLTTHNTSSIHSIALILSPFILLFFKFSICFWCDHSSLRTA
jgi:hypothetical protein